MVTLFGKYVRKLRIEHDEILLNMAQKLSVSTAYLSAVENGNRKVPENWLEKIVAYYSLNYEEKISLEEAIIKTNKNINLTLDQNMSEAKKELAISFARELDELSDEDIKKILKVLRRRIN